MTLAFAVMWSAAGLALFTNGGLETGTLAGWTKQSFLNPGLQGAAPYGYTSIVRNLGGSDRTRVVGSPGTGPLSLPDATMGASADLRVPRFGDHAAVVNENVTGRNANVLRQSTFVQSSDIDSLDGQVHVRLAFAPVLDDGAHSAQQQAWFFLVLRNKSRGGAILYESFAYANQPGVPWKTHSTGLKTYTYTDWQVVDIAPGNASLAVGDEVELEAIAAGCSQGGHAGWVYVDAFGSYIPGPNVVAHAPALVNASSPLTYTLTARNQGSADLAGGVITFTVPTNTTFVSVSDATSCSQTAGVVTCNIGALAVNALYSTEVTVNVGAVSNGTVITAGNYSIEGTGEPPLLGPPVNSSVTGNSLVDLSMEVDNGLSGAANGQTLTYTIVARNLSGTPISGVLVSANPPSTLTGVTWSCVAAGASSCTPGGSGAVADTITLDANGSVTYTLTGTVAGLSGTLSLPATVTGPGGTTDPAPSNNAAADNDVFVANTAPTAVADMFTIAEDTVLAVPAGLGVLANDSDANDDTLGAVLISAPVHGVVSLAADGSLTYSPAANYFGPDAFVYVASDGTVTSAPVTVTLVVSPVNDAPTAGQPPDLAYLWNAAPQTVTVTGLSAGAGETDSLTVTAISSVPGTVVVGPVTYGGGSTASFSVAPVNGRHGVATVSVVVSDGGLSVTRSFAVTLSAPPFYVTRVYPATGPAPGGTHIRIHGGGFMLASTGLGSGVGVVATSPVVLINGVPAPTAIVESDGVVSAVTPALPAGQPLDVQLMLPAGTGTLTRAYTPYARPAPTEPGEPVDPAQPERPADPTNPMDPTAPTVDSDSDGVSDVWEAFYGLDPFDPTDAAADPDADGRSNLQEFQGNTHPDGQQTRYFAEGNAQPPFRTWVNFYNPAVIEAAINLTFFLDDATVVKHLVKSPAGARLTVDAATIPGLQGHAFGLRVEADEAVVINRTITWNDQGVGATAERAVELSTTWYFAEGATHRDLQTFLLLANPSDAGIVANVEYLMATGQSVLRTHVVPAHSRVTVWVNQEGTEMVDQGFGMVVRASAPLVAERATYIVHDAMFDAGETSVGSPVTSLDWYFAEGSSGPFFEAFLLLANPNDDTAQVQVRYLADHGGEVVRTHAVGPRSRVTVPINDEYAWDGWTGMGMHVTSTNGVAIVAERAMWWSTDDDASWEEGHGSAGFTAPATSFAIGDGVAGGPEGASTYLLLANPTSSDATVLVTLGFEDGTAAATRNVVVPAGRRLTIDVVSSFPMAAGKRFSARVDSTNAVPIVVEQSIYWSFNSGLWKTGVSLPATRLR